MKLHLNEYHGPNFIDPLADKLVNNLDDIDELLDKIRKEIKKNKFLKTTVDRDFKYVEQFVQKAIKYAKLAAKAVDDVKT